MAAVNSNGSKAKRWCFTCFNVENEPEFSETDQDYLCYGREVCPDTSRKHLQGFVVFKNRKTLAQCKKWRANAHFERARGTPEEASQYCKKDNDFCEFGRLPSTTGRVDKFRDLLDKAEAGKISDIKADYPGLYIRYKNTLQSALICDTTELNNSCGVWLYGPPRSGKDYAVRQLTGVYNKMLNKWWCGYKNEPYVLLSDVEPDHGKWLGYYLKIWADRYAFNAEIKGGSMLIRPKKMFVSSNFSMEACFSGEILSALLARFTQYDYSGSECVVTRRLSVQPSTRFIDVLKANEDGLQFKEEISTPVQEDPQEGTSSDTATSKKHTATSPAKGSESRKVHCQKV